MALTKPGMIEAVHETIRHTNPAEHPVATLAVVWGEEHPLLSALITGINSADTHFVTLTDRTVLVHRIKGAFTRRPGHLTLSLGRPEARAAITDPRRGPLWSSFRLRSPNDPEPVRLSVCRMWFPEMNHFLTELSR